jgi:hypothetical protein
MQAVQFALTSDNNGLDSKRLVSNNDSSSNSVSNVPQPTPATQRESEVTSSSSVYFAIQLPLASRDKSLGTIASLMLTTIAYLFLIFIYMSEL